MFSALAPISAVLCVGTVALWVRSYWNIDGFYSYKYLTLDGREPYTSRRFQYDGPPTAIGVHVIIRSSRGHIVLSHSRYKINFSPASPSIHWVNLPIVGGLLPEAGHSHLWFHWRSLKDSNESFQELWIPLWFIAAITAIPGVQWLNQFRRRRLEAGKVLCSTCGYDLRATPDR